MANLTLRIGIFFFFSKVDYLFQGIAHQEKLKVVKDICAIEHISLDEVAYIGDDINCYELLSSIGLPACPANSDIKIKQIPNIIHLKKNGGDGAVREFIGEILKQN